MSHNEFSEFEIIYNEYKKKIFALVYRLLRDAEESEDSTQEVFVKAYKSYGKFRHEAHVYSWLYRIAVNVCNERLRKKKACRDKVGIMLSLDNKTQDSDGKEISAQIPDTSQPMPLEIFERQQQIHIVRKTILSLPDKYRDIIILREIENTSYEEISNILNISIETVGVRLIRAREKLKKKLKNFL